MERQLLSESELHKIIDMKDYDTALRYIMNLFPMNEIHNNDCDEILSEMLQNTFNEIEEMIKGSEIDLLEKHISPIAPLRYEYDCHNLKSAIKCEALNIDPEKIYINCGTVDAVMVTESVKNRDFTLFPVNMKEAAIKAIDTLSSSKDPQTVDLILDKATFEDMHLSANQSGNKYVAGLIECKSDISNILSFVRCSRQRRPINFLESVILPCGSLSKHVFMKCYDVTVDKLIKELEFSDYHEIYSLFNDKDFSMQELERTCENIFMDKVRSAKYIPFGYEVAVAFLEAKQYEIKNLRIVLSGKKSDISPEILKERLRVSY